MTVRLLLFAAAARAAGVREATIEIDDAATVGDALVVALRRWPSLAPLEGSLLLAKNETWCARMAPLAEGDTLAIMPPANGG